MTIRSAAAQFAEAIGEEIAGGDDHIQADLLNGFFGMFYRSMTNDGDRDLQIAYVMGKLNRTTRVMLERFADFARPEINDLPPL